MIEEKEEEEEEEEEEERRVKTLCAFGKTPPATCIFSQALLVESISVKRILLFVMVVIGMIIFVGM